MCQRSHAGHEEVGATPHVDEPWNSGDPLAHGICLDREGARVVGVVGVVRAGDGVGCGVEETLELRAVDPVLLDELELLGDVGVEAQKVQAARFVIVGCGEDIGRVHRLRDRRPVGASPAQDAVEVGVSL